jgi:hypothetical protein
MDRAGQGERGEGGEHRDDRVAQPQTGVVGLLIEADRVQGIRPDTRGGGTAEQRPYIQPRQGRGLGEDQQRAHSVGDEAVDHEREEVGEESADVDGDSHLPQGVIAQGASGEAEGHDGETVPGSDRRDGGACSGGGHAAFPRGACTGVDAAGRATGCCVPGAADAGLPAAGVVFFRLFLGRGTP